MLKKNARRRLGKFPDRPDHYRPCSTDFGPSLTRKAASKAKRQQGLSHGVFIQIPGDPLPREVVGFEGGLIKVEGYQMLISPVAIFQ